MKSNNVYSHPVRKEDVTGVLSDPQTHVGMDKHAIDYIVNEGSQILSAAKGEIIFIKTDSKEGGDESKYEDFKFYNHIVIKHDNNEYTEYGHLQFNSSTRQVGEKVNEGDIIALCGNTGYSERPHLHFSVFQLNNVEPNFNTLPDGKTFFINDNDFGFETIEPKFK